MKTRQLTHTALGALLATAAYIPNYYHLILPGTTIEKRVSELTDDDGRRQPAQEYHPFVHTDPETTTLGPGEDSVSAGRQLNTTSMLKGSAAGMPISAAAVVPAIAALLLM